MKSHVLQPLVALGVLLACHPTTIAQSPDGANGDGRLTDLCRLIEALPEDKDPIRRAPPFRGAIRSLKRDLRATQDGRPLGAARAAQHLKKLESALGKSLKGAQKAFHLEKEERWSRGHQSRAKKFLKGNVFNRSASLRVGEFGFEPTPPLRALLLWSACWAGAHGPMIAYARGATHPDESPARALAALALERLERREEARELLKTLTGEGFLVAFAQSRLSDDPETRRRQRALAARRATTRWQRSSMGLESPRGAGGR